MLCGELVNGGLASAGAVAVPCGLGLWLPGCLRAGLSPRPLTGSPYLPILAELLAAAYLEELRLAAEVDESNGGHCMETINNRNASCVNELELQLQDDIDEDVLLGERKFLCIFLFLFFFKSSESCETPMRCI